MKKLYKPIFIFLISIIFLGFNSCDVLEQLFFNLKLSEEFHSTGNGPNISEIINDCLSNDDSFDDNFDKIQNLKYVSAAYYTLDATPQNLGGSNISATLTDCNGNVILQQSLPTAQASDYVDNPYEFTLTQAQIDIFNQYLANYQECDCFTAVLLVEQVTPANSAPYTLNGVVEIVIEVEASLN
jgi:hypothetical protein